MEEIKDRIDEIIYISKAADKSVNEMRTKLEIREALLKVLEFSQEPGNNLYDVQQFIFELIEET